MTNFKGYCDTCAFAGLNQPAFCALKNKIVKATDYCSEHRNSVTTCDICGNIILASGIIDSNHIICSQCFSVIHTCAVCKHVDSCAYQTDPSPLPKTIPQQVRQGNIIAVTQVINPERVRITCQKGCKCYSKENDCLKQNNSFCGNHEVYYEEEN